MRSKIITVVAWILTPIFPAIWLVEKVYGLLSYWQEQIEYDLDRMFGD